MHRLTLCGVLALLAGGFSDVHAALQTPVVSGGAVSVTGPVSGKYTVTVTSGTDVTVTLRFDAGDVVEEILVTPLNQSGAKVAVTVEGVPYAPNPNEPDTEYYGLHQIKNLVRGVGAGEVWITKVQANLIGDVDRTLDVGGNPNPLYGQTSGLIKADLIGNVLANWSVLAGVEATGTSLSNPDLQNDVIDVVRAALDGTWYPQYALDGAILGDIRSNGGNIGTIQAASFISAVNNEASSNTQVIDTSGGNIGEILAGNVNNAGSLGEVTIDCGSGSVGKIQTRHGGWGYDEGPEVYLSDPIDFEPDGRPTGYSTGGTLIAGSLGDLLIEGSLDSTLLVTSVAQSGVWKVGDSLGPNAVVTLRNGGLTGQIAINANGGAGEWLGTVRVAQGSNVVSGPWYELDDADHNVSPSAIGAGGAGLQGYEV